MAGRGEIVRELIQFVVIYRKWWIGTVILLLLLLGSFLVLTEQSAFAPFIYALF